MKTLGALLLTAGAALVLYGVANLLFGAGKSGAGSVVLDLLFGFVLYLIPGGMLCGVGGAMLRRKQA